MVMMTRVQNGNVGGGGQNGILGLVHGMFLNMSEQDVLTCTREGK